MSHDPNEKRANSAPAAQKSTRGEILLVDDERNALRALKARLEGEGFAVRTADDGLAALEPRRS